MQVEIIKCHGSGNKFVMVDMVSGEAVGDMAAFSRAICSHPDVESADGLLYVVKQGDYYAMRMFNPDGSEGEMCGNALRSLSKYVYDHGMTDKTEFEIETLGGMQHIWLEVENGKAVNITADIGQPRMDTKIIPVNTDLAEFVDQPVEILDRVFHITAVSWGNPHCVMFIDDTASFDVAKYGPVIEHYTDLFPNKTNVTFAQVVARDYIKIREWERGTGETIGCGTGCCTAAVAAAMLGYCDRKVTVEQIGGNLYVDWREEDGHVRMTGPSHTVFEGVLFDEA